MDQVKESNKIGDVASESTEDDPEQLSEQFPGVVVVTKEYKGKPTEWTKSRNQTTAAEAHC